MKRLVLILLVVSLILLCGSPGYREINRGYLVTAIGFCVQHGSSTIILEAISSSDVADKPSEATVLSGTGKDFDEAFDTLAQQLTKPLYFEQLGTAVADKSLSDDQLEVLADFCKNLPSVNYDIYIVKTNDINTLFNTETENGVLGYDIIGIIKNFEKQNRINLSNQLYEICRSDTKGGIASVPEANITDGSLTLTSFGGVKYE